MVTSPAAVDSLDSEPKGLSLAMRVQFFRSFDQTVDLETSPEWYAPAHLLQVRPAATGFCPNSHGCVRIISQERNLCMAKKTTKKTSKKVNPKITRAATVAAGKAMNPKKKTVAGKMKAAMKKPLMKVAKVKKTLASKAK